MALYFSKKYWLVTWQLASAISLALAGGSTCLPDVTFTGIHDEPIEWRREVTLPTEETVQQAWIQFRIDGPFCGRQGHCCATEVSVSQGGSSQVLQGLEAGIDRISNGHNLAFLDNMEWTPRHAILASCSAVAETAIIHLTFPQAALFCLQPSTAPENNSNSSGTASGHSQDHVAFPEWRRDLMHVHIWTDASPGTLQQREGSTGLRIEWSDVRQGAHPEAYDLVVIPFEAEEPLLLVQNALLLGGQAIVSEVVLMYAIAESDAAEARQPAGRAEDTFVHMHVSGWEVYVQERLMLGERTPELTRTERQHVKVAYHMAAIGEYKIIVQQHFGRLIFSGLYDTVQGIYCYILGASEEELKEARALVQTYGRKVIVAGTSTNLTLYERFTLLGIRAHLGPGDVFLYMHSKGVKPRNAESWARVADWTFYMQYFVLKQHHACRRLLSEGFDLCGVDFNTIPQGHYSGNFWWATASYYLTLPDRIGEEYYEPEMYVASGNPRHAALWAGNNNMYMHEYPPARYVDTANTALRWQDIEFEFEQPNWKHDRAEIEHLE